MLGWTVRREADIAAQVAQAVSDAKVACAAEGLLSYMTLVGERDSLKAELEFWGTQARGLQTAMATIADVSAQAVRVAGYRDDIIAEVRQRAEA